MPKAFAKTIKWLGHDAFRVDAKKTPYFDPYQIASGPDADLASFLTTILTIVFLKMC